MRARSQDDTGHDTDGFPHASPGQSAHSRGWSTADNHAERHGRAARRGQRHGDRPGADLLGVAGPTHLSLPPFIRLCPRGDVPAESH